MAQARTLKRTELQRGGAGGGGQGLEAHYSGSSSSREGQVPGKQGRLELPSLMLKFCSCSYELQMLRKSVEPDSRITCA